jgi:hypothetical protein
MAPNAPWVHTYVLDHAEHDGEVIYEYTCTGIRDPDMSGVGASWPVKHPTPHRRLLSRCSKLRGDTTRLLSSLERRDCVWLW